MKKKATICPNCGGATVISCDWEEGMESKEVACPKKCGMVIRFKDKTTEAFEVVDCEYPDCQYHSHSFKECCAELDNIALREEVRCPYLEGG